MVATDVALLVQVPPDVASLNVTGGAPGQVTNMPVMDAGNGLTVIGLVTKQPPGKV